MWLPNLADEEAMTDVFSRHADALGLPGEVEHGAAARRTAHAPAPSGVTAVSRLGDVPRQAASRRAGAPVRQGLSRRRGQRGRVARRTGRSAAPGRVCTWASSTSSCGGSPRTRSSPRCPPWSPRSWPPASCPRPCATSSGCSRESSCARRSFATNRRRVPRCASRSRAASARRPSSPRTLPTGRSPTSRPDSSRCGPRRSTRHAPPGRRTAGGGSGTRRAVDPRRHRTPAGTSRGPGPAARCDRDDRGAAGRPARILRAPDAGCHGRRSAGRSPEEGSQAGAGPPPGRLAGDRARGRGDETPSRRRPRAGLHPARRLPPRPARLLGARTGAGRPRLAAARGPRGRPGRVPRGPGAAGASRRRSRTTSPGGCCRPTSPRPGPRSTPPCWPSVPMSSS